MDAKEAIKILDKFDIEEYHDAIRYAQRVLEYAIPCTVEHKEDGNRICGNCGYEFRKSEIFEDSYCPECGIALRW